MQREQHAQKFCSGVGGNRLKGAAVRWMKYLGCKMKSGASRVVHWLRVDLEVPALSSRAAVRIPHEGQ